MIRVYYDNVVVSGRIVEDLGPAEVAAVQVIERAHELGVIKRVTSRQAWREQEGAPEPLRATLHAARGDLSVVASDHVVLGAAALDGLYGRVPGRGGNSVAGPLAATKALSTTTV